MKKISVFAPCRPTFDVDYAREFLAKMAERLNRTGHALSGTDSLLLDKPATDAAMARAEKEKPDLLLVLQLTFTDAVFVCELAKRFSAGLAIWALPEPRTGGRLRLNSFCGLNLASHALSRMGKDFSYLYADPDAEGIEEKLRILTAGKSSNKPIPQSIVTKAKLVPQDIRIARIGEHPEGFDTCRFDAAELKELTGAEVDEWSLDELFDRARNIAPARLKETRQEAEALLKGTEAVDSGELDASLRLKNALDDIQGEKNYHAMAIRCWPETFTEYGAAVCGPVSMLGEARVPCACEADVYGAVSQVIMQRICGDVVFLADLVDVDTAGDTAVAWHCGQAPISMAAADSIPTATVHTNRKKPLLFQFSLKPGRITFFRLSQSANEPKFIVGTGEMLAAPAAYTGTCGTFRPDSGSGNFLKNLIGSGAEHHMVFAYGDHLPALLKAANGMPVVNLCGEA